jgi:hypothetical protein
MMASESRLRASLAGRNEWRTEVGRDAPGLGFEVDRMVAVSEA